MELAPRFLIPEIILLAAACICTLMGISRRDALRRLCQLIAALACAVAFAAAITNNFGLVSDFTLNISYTPGFNPNYITLLATAIGFLTILAAWDMPAKSDPAVPDSQYRGEFYGMLLFSLAGVAMIGKVNDLVWLFVVLELVSIPTYIMVATGRSQIIAQEAGVKYFFLGALAAAIFLFGFSYLYGAAGSTRFNDIYAWFMSLQVHHQDMPMLAVIGLILIIVGIGYKIAAVPLHFYAPDVYQGAATPVTAFLAFAPKTAGIVAIISVLTLFDFRYTGNGAAISAVLSVIAVLTMSVGNVMALLQRNLKRLLAYSSIAHSGYMLVGLVAMGSLSPLNADDNGVSATIFYLTAYAIMNLGAFAVLIYLQGKADAAEDFDDIAGIAKSHPAAALMFTLCLFSLIGMPLTIGFLGKFYIIQKALGTGHTTLAVITVINAAVAAAYYLRIIAAMYLREPLYPFTLRKPAAIRISALVCSAAVIAGFIAPHALFIAANPIAPDANSVEARQHPAAPPAADPPVTAAR